MIICHRAVCIPVKLRKRIDKLPHLFIARMENVRSIPVYMDILYILTVNISACMIPFFFFFLGFSLLFCIPGKYACIKSASHQDIIVFFHILFLSFYWPYLCADTDLYTTINDAICFSFIPVPGWYPLSILLSRSYSKGIPRKYHLIRKRIKRWRG